VAEPFAQLVGQQRAALIGTLTDISAASWDLPTICTGWSVKDVASHLVDGELLFGRVYRGEIDELVVDNEEGVGRWRKVDPETVRYSLWHHGSATQRVIDSRSEQSWGRAVTHGGSPIDLRRALVMHFFELAVHSHDITDALGRPANWDDRGAALAEYCISLAPAALAFTPAAGTLEIRIADGTTHILDGTSGEWLPASDAVAGSAATWHTDAETLVLATTGRIPVADALARTKVEGDATILEAVLADWQLAR